MIAHTVVPVLPDNGKIDIAVGLPRVFVSGVPVPSTVIYVELFVAIILKVPLLLLVKNPTGELNVNLSRDLTKEEKELLDKIIEKKVSEI